MRKWYDILFSLLLLCLPAVANAEQGAWQKVQIPNRAFASGMVVIQSIGNATMGKESKEAILYLAGIPRSGRFTFGIFIGNLDKEWQGVPWDDFRGPDLSESAIKATPLEVAIQLADRKVSSRFRVLVSGVLLPKEQVGKMAEGIIVSSDEAIRKGCSLKELFESMANGYKAIDIKFQYGKAKNVVSVFANGGSKNEILAEFLAENKRSK